MIFGVSSLPIKLLNVIMNAYMGIYSCAFV
jgi:hypothetical protein